MQYYSRGKISAYHLQRSKHIIVQSNNIILVFQTINTNNFICRLIFQVSFYKKPRQMIIFLSDFSAFSTLYLQLFPANRAFCRKHEMQLNVSDLQMNTNET